MPTPVLAPRSGPSTVPAGGSSGQALVKQSASDYDVAWGTVGAGAADWAVKTANYTAADGDKLLCPTGGGAFTVLLPGSPSTGNWVWVQDPGSTWNAHNLTVGRNGATIEGAAADAVLGGNAAGYLFVYDGSTWQQLVTAPVAAFTPVQATGTGASQNITIPVTGLAAADLVVSVNGARWYSQSGAYTLSGTTVTLTAPSGADILIEMKGAGPQGPIGPSGSVNLGSATPQALGTASAGSSANAARDDHVHPFPAASVFQVVATLDATTGAIANTETQVLGWTAPANTFAVGSKIRVQAVGTLTNTTSASTSVYRLRIGSTTLTGNIPASLSFVNGTTAKTSIIVRVDILVNIISTGSSGTAIGQVQVVTGITPGTTPTGVTAAVTVDTTANKVVEFTYISGASSTNVVWHAATLEVLI